jgi:hypothetical protein
MIDNPDQAERLLAGLRAALPLPARVTPELAATLRAQDAALGIKAACSVTSISYAGDEGGIVCGLDFGGEADKAVYASITHLRFDPRLPLARDIAAYQKHRVKRLRHQPS